MMSEQETASNPPSECTEMSEEDVSLKGSQQSRPTRSSRNHSSAASNDGEQRRHSTRSVKRRKFDDELVESSLNNKQEKAKNAAKNATEGPVTPLSTDTPIKVEVTDMLSDSNASLNRSMRSATSDGGMLSSLTAPHPSPTPAKPSTSGNTHKKASPTTEKKKATTKAPAKSISKKAKKSTLPARANANKNLGRWKPHDDLLLIEAVMQTSDLKSVHVGVKFSCNFSLQEIEDRWYTLLYNEKISKIAMTAVQQLGKDEIARVESKALFSKQEEDLLCTVTVASQPTQATFSELLSNNLRKFHRVRTSQSLHEHWMLMKHYHLLPDQAVQPLPRNDHVLNFSDAEDMLDDKQLSEPADTLAQKEMAISDRKQKKEIRCLEQELSKWQVLVESISGTGQAEFDSQTLAILRGRLVRYLMRSKEISIGRAAKDNQVDVDLSLEGPSSKISRRQGTIKLRNNGEFILTNCGKRSLYVDGRPVQPNGRLKLHNNSVIEISCLRFIFLINQSMVRSMKNEGQKSTTMPESVPKVTS
ncbi:microspherule protein 1-like [Watersipora subatra]|uniref:microspherule protein 1-like n=1 Tax=Watersipora subatra TaxID=2589382 RepID=UPI00355B66F1